MKLINNLSNQGYCVTDTRTQSGTRIVRINGKDAWVQCVFRHPCPLSLAKLKIEFLQRAVRNLIHR